MYGLGVVFVVGFRFEQGVWRRSQQPSLDDFIELVALTERKGGQPASLWFLAFLESESGIGRKHPQVGQARGWVCQ